MFSLLFDYNYFFNYLFVFAVHSWLQFEFVTKRILQSGFDWNSAIFYLLIDFI